MQEYRSNKIRTAAEIVRRIENWPAAFAMRLSRRRPGLRLLNFRNGLNVLCRGATRDWDVVHELFFAGSYRRAMDYLRELAGSPLVLDLGGNIGLFGLLSASSHPRCEVISFEPGPPNYRLFEMNRLANPALAERIELRKQAVGGKARATEWFFDEQNPGGSGLFTREGKRYPVQIAAFSEVVEKLSREVALAKIDIEGAEYEILAATPAESWQRMRAISIEVHDDPEKKVSRDDFLGRFRNLGFKIEPETVCSYFLHR